jgi:hypothetical protein
MGEEYQNKKMGRSAKAKSFVSKLKAKTEDHIKTQFHFKIISPLTAPVKGLYQNVKLRQEMELLCTW